MKNRLFCLLAAAALCSACANTASIARVHPEAVSGLPNCSECHSGTPLAGYNHKAADFYQKHRYFAGANRQSCAACHQESFCSDCHDRKSEVKPSDRFAGQPARNLPHRGDFLSQHMIDGKVNPASCAKCHGRQNNARCVSCHK